MIQKRESVGFVLTPLIVKVFFLVLLEFTVKNVSHWIIGGIIYC